VDNRSGVVIGWTLESKPAPGKIFGYNHFVAQSTLADANSYLCLDARAQAVIGGAMAGGRKMARPTQRMAVPPNCGAMAIEAQTGNVAA